MLAPTPPPTPEQAERNERAAKEANEHAAEQQHKAGSDERRLTEEIQRDKQARYDRWTGREITDPVQRQQQERTNGRRRSRTR
jgi:hypothetical protein